MLTTIINKASKTRRNVLIALITAVILIATSQSAAAFSFYNNGFASGNNGTPCYKTANPRACYKGLTDEIINRDQVDIAPRTSNSQDGLSNQNNQVNQICIAFTCTQTSTVFQTIEDPIITGDDNEGDLIQNDPPLFLQSSNTEKVVKTPFKVNVILTYKNTKSISSDLLRVTAYDAKGHDLSQDLDLASYDLDGQPIKLTFKYNKNEVPVGAQGQVCVSNLSEIDSTYNCASYINGSEHEPESVTLVIPKSRQ